MRARLEVPIMRLSGLPRRCSSQFAILAALDGCLWLWIPAGVVWLCALGSPDGGGGRGLLIRLLVKGGVNLWGEFTLVSLLGAGIPLPGLWVGVWWDVLPWESWGLFFPGGPPVEFGVWVPGLLVVSLFPFGGDLVSGLLLGGLCGDPSEEEMEIGGDWGCPWCLWVSGYLPGSDEGILPSWRRCGGMYGGTEWIGFRVGFPWSRGGPVGFPILGVAVSGSPMDSGVDRVPVDPWGVVETLVPWGVCPFGSGVPGVEGVCMFKTCLSYSLMVPGSSFFPIRDFPQIRATWAAVSIWVWVRFPSRILPAMEVRRVSNSPL